VYLHAPRGIPTKSPAAENEAVQGWAEIMNTKILGRMEAVLELIQVEAEAIRRDRESTQQVIFSLNRALTLIHEFSDKLVPLLEWMKKHERVDWLTTTELAAEMKTTSRHIRYLYETGQIPGYQFEKKGHIRFDRQEVYREIKQGGIHGRRAVESA